MSETNPFGGKNPNGLYVPITDTEMEVLDRLRTDHGFRIEIKDWGYVDDPVMKFGDKRVSFEFTMVFKAPDTPMEVRSFEMSLWTKTGIHLFGPRSYATIVGGQPLKVHAGFELQLALDIALDQMSGHLVRLVKPGAFGLTSYHGNLHLTEDKQKLLAAMREGEARVRTATALEAWQAKRKP